MQQRNETIWWTLVLQIEITAASFLLGNIIIAGNIMVSYNIIESESNRQNSISSYYWAFDFVNFYFLPFNWYNN